MPMSNWTQLADEWLAKASAARGLDVTVLPYTETLRDLPPTAETIRINGTNLDQLSRVRKLLTSLRYVSKFGAFQTFIDRDSFSKTLTYAIYLEYLVSLCHAHIPQPIFHY